MSAVHRHQKVARFGDCDPAALVFFPRFFEWFHEAMESWFDEALGHPYTEVLKRWGFPAVKTEASFKRPVHMGESITIELRLGHLGRASLRLDYRVVGRQGVLHATGSTTVCTIGVQPGLDDHERPVAIPDDLRRAMLAFGIWNPGA